MDETKKDFFKELLKRHSIKNGECLEWTGKLNRGGYGYIFVFKKTWTPHRISYEMKHGEIEKGFYICHTCNNKKCFNIEHLYAGTAQENSEDFKNSAEWELKLKRYAESVQKRKERKEKNYENSEFLTIDQTAALFNVHPITIRRAIHKGHLTAIRIGMGPKSPYRISRKQIEAIHHSMIQSLASKTKGG